MKIELINFEGIQPKLSAHLLQEPQAQLAENVRAEKGDLRSWAAGLSVADLAAADYKSLYQYSFGAETNWVYSANDLDFAHPAIANDTFERLYFTGESEPRVFANDLDSDPWVQSTDYYKLGPAVPVDTETWGFVSGHTGGTEYRAYVYTYVSRYGEETGPIKTVLATTTYNTGDVIIEDFTQPPANYGLRSTVDGEIPYVRIYRTNSSQSGAEFQYVGQFNATTHTFGTDTFTDDVADADLGEVLPTEKFEGVNASMIGLIGLPNGIFAGFVGNELYLSEPYFPHAWPDEYVLVFDYDIVGLGIDGTNIIVMTEGYTYVVYGPTPEEMQKQRLPGFYPCLFKRSIVSTPYGVFFTSHEGLVKATAQTQEVITEQHMSPAEWEAYRPETMHGVFYNNKYFGWIGYAGEESGIIFDIGTGILTTNGSYHEATYIQITSGTLYTINTNNEIAEWEGDPYNFQYYRWKSKKFLLPLDTGFTCGQIIVDLDTYDTIIAALEDNSYLEGLNAAIFATGDLNDTFNYGDGTTTLDMTYNYEEFNGTNLYDLNSISMSNAIVFKLYVDGALVAQRSITDDHYFRLPATRGRRIEVQLEGYIPIRRCILAQSPRELR
jgi:hypothetical protein